MSAPDTNVEKQVKRHKTPLAGMAIAGAFSGLLLLAFLLWLSANGNTPEETGPQVEVTPGLGATVESDG